MKARRNTDVGWGRREAVIPHDDKAAFMPARLGDVTESMKNGLYKPSTEYSDDGIPCLRMYNIDAGKIVWRDIKRMRVTDKELKDYGLIEGDLLVNRVNSRELVGKTAYILSGMEASVFESKNIRLRLKKDKVLPKFINYQLLTFGRSHFSNNAQQVVGMASVSQKQLADFPIVITDIDHQKRIVAEIEKQFSRLDEAVANLKRVKANLKRYKAAVLKAAVEGKLTEEWRKAHPDIEPARKLIERVEQPPRPNRYKTRSKDLIKGHPALAVGNPGTELPAGWSWTPLIDIARMESGHTPSRRHPEWWDGESPWIGIADAREHDGKTIHDTVQHTNEDGLANSAARLLPAGTVCVSRTASVGYVVVMGKPMATSQDFVNWVPTEAVSCDWLRILFSADREALRRFGKGSVHKTIYFPEWLSVHIALPPMEEQYQIVAKVERRISSIQQFDSSMVTNSLRAERLRQSILEYSFKEHLSRLSSWKSLTNC